MIWSEQSKLKWNTLYTGRENCLSRSVNEDSEEILKTEARGRG